MLDGGDERGEVGEVSAGELDLWDLVLDDPRLGIVLPSDQASDLVSLADQQLCEVPTVLTGDTGDQCPWHGAPFRLCRTDGGESDGRGATIGGDFQWAERLLEAFSCPSIAKLDGVGGAAQDLSYFGVAETLPDDHREEVAVSLLERGERHLRAGVAIEGEDREGRRPFLEEAVLQPHPSEGGAAIVRHRPPGDPEEPEAVFGRSGDLGESAPGDEEHLGDDVLGVVEWDAPADVARYRGQMALVEGVELGTR